MSESDSNVPKKCVFQNPYIKYGSISVAVIGIGGCLYYYFKK
jgi:hypothetical protein